MASFCKRQFGVQGIEDGTEPKGWQFNPFSKCESAEIDALTSSLFEPR